jgi:dipeptidyl-peptidase-4
LDAENRVFFTLNKMDGYMKISGIALFLLFVAQAALGQRSDDIRWTAEGDAFTMLQNGQLVRIEVATGSQQVVVKRDELKVNGEALEIESYSFSDSGNWLLIFTNTARVWRYNSRGDYWMFNMKDRSLHQVGKQRPAQSLMLPRYQPDGNRVAYVSMKNIYVEDVKTGAVKALTTNGKDKLINGTFDWCMKRNFSAAMGFDGALTVKKSHIGRLTLKAQGIIV